MPLFSKGSSGSGEENLPLCDVYSNDRLPSSFDSPTRLCQQLNALANQTQPDDTLAKIVGSKPLSRSEVTKKVWDYIKKNKLQDAKTKTLINADDVLKAVFGGKKQVTMFEMTKHVSGHLR